MEKVCFIQVLYPVQAIMICKLLFSRGMLFKMTSWTDPIYRTDISKPVQVEGRVAILTPHYTLFHPIFPCFLPPSFPVIFEAPLSNHKILYHSMKDTVEVDQHITGGSTPQIVTFRSKMLKMR